MLTQHPLPCWCTELPSIMPASTVSTTGERRNLDGISNYTKFWQKDAKNDTDTDMANRLTEYTSVVNGAQRRHTPLPLFATAADTAPPQATTTAPPTCTSTAGARTFTLLATIPVRPSTRPSLGTSTTWPTQWGSRRRCASSMLAAVWEDQRERLLALPTSRLSV